MVVDPELIAAFTVPASILGTVWAFMHYATQWRLEKGKASADVENRLARVEVAIDDLSAAISQMTESHRFLTAALGQRGLPVEASRGSE